MTCVPTNSRLFFFFSARAYGQATQVPQQKKINDIRRKCMKRRTRYIAAYFNWCTTRSNVFEAFFFTKPPPPPHTLDPLFNTFLRFLEVSFSCRIELQYTPCGASYTRKNQDENEFQWNGNKREETVGCAHRSRDDSNEWIWKRGKGIESEYSQRNKTEQLSTIARQRKDFCSATYGP